MKKNALFNCIKTVLAFVLGSLCFRTGTAQNIGHGNIPDSLVQKSYQELRDIYYPLIDANDTIKATFYINALIKKAKLENEIIEQASGYDDISFISKDEVSFNYSDSIVALTKNKTHFRYPTCGYLEKGRIQFNRGDYEEALDNFLIASKKVDKRNIRLILIIKQSISSIKQRANLHQEAIQIDLQALRLIRKQDDFTSKFHDYYTDTLFNLCIGYLHLNEDQKAKEYIDQAILESINMGDSLDYYKYLSTSAEIKYRSGNYPKAIELFSECIPKTEGYSLANVYTFRGKAYWVLGKTNQAILDFEMADSVLWEIKDFSPEILEVYATLNSYYEKEGDIEKQLACINKLMHVDSVLDADALYLSKEIKNQYDIPLLMAERQEIIDALENKNTNYSKWMYGLSIALLSSLLWGFYYYQKRLGYKRKFEALLKAPAKETKSKLTKKDAPEDLGIAPAVSAKILERLVIFEETKGYLKPNTSLQELAKNLETNSNYLSKIINVYRQKNFSSYISGLRVDYIIEELKTNPNFRKYTIKAIAVEVGFGNAESFTKAFKAKTGIYPSYYIKRLNKEAN